MYQPDTVLTLKDPRSTEEEPFPYDRVRVVGQSPVDHGLTSSAWTGSNGQGVIVTPLTSFGSTIDEPYGKLQRLYEVESIPEVVVPVAATVKVLQQTDAGPSPEDVFAQEAEGAGNDGRTVKPPAPVVSPLDGAVQGVEVVDEDSPLGETQADDVPPAPEPKGKDSPLDG